MDDLISREAAFKSVHSLFKSLPQYLADKMNVGYNHALADTLATLKALPSAERRGRWEMKEDPYGFFDTIPICSACGCTPKYRVTSAYCPNCGARMEAKE